VNDPDSSVVHGLDLFYISCAILAIYFRRFHLHAVRLILPASVAARVRHRSHGDRRKNEGVSSGTLSPFQAYSSQEKPNENNTLADFGFDLDLPIAPARVVSPGGTASANGVEILLDRIIVTPAYTPVYLCYSKPSEEDWATSMETTVTVDGKRSSSNDYAHLFDPAIADGSKGGDPGWTPPVKDRRCVKLGFPVGDDDPHALTLNIPSLERSRPDFIPQSDLDAAYAKLRVQGIEMEWHAVNHGAYPEFNRLPSV